MCHQVGMLFPMHPLRYDDLDRVVEILEGICTSTDLHKEMTTSAAQSADMLPGR